MPWNGAIGIAAAGGCVMYTVLGYLLANDELGVFDVRRNRRMLYAAGVVELFFDMCTRG